MSIMVQIPLDVAVWAYDNLKGQGYIGKSLMDLHDAIEATKNTGSKADDQAAEIYEHYPRKAARPAAIRAIKTAIKKVGFGPLLEHVQRYAEFHKATHIDMQYTPMSSTWFNQERWNDTPVTVAPVKASMHDMRQKIRTSRAFAGGPYYVSYATEIERMQLRTWRDELLRLNPHEDFDSLRA